MESESDGNLSEELFGNDKSEKKESKVSWQEAAIEKNKINPNENKIETTKMLAQRLKKPVYEVYHDTDWSEIFDLTKNINLIFDKTLRKIDKFVANHHVFTMKLLSPIECEKLIELTEIYKYEDCGYPKTYRSNTRLIINDINLSNKLYERIKQFMPSIFKYNNMNWKMYGLNQRFRFCKYIKRQKFGIHVDQCFYRNLRDRSLYTVNIYLNTARHHKIKNNNNDNDDADEKQEYEQGFKGGRTQFFEINTETGKLIKEPIWNQTAEQGLAVIFGQPPQQIHHNGEMVEEGVKYLMRTDIMYKLVSNQ